MNQYDWYQMGLDHGWCGPLVCAMHDSLMTDDEAEAHFDGDDPCIFAVRVLDQPTEGT